MVLISRHIHGLSIHIASFSNQYCTEVEHNKIWWDAQAVHHKRPKCEKSLKLKYAVDYVKIEHYTENSNCARLDSQISPEKVNISCFMMQIDITWLYHDRFSQVIAAAGMPEIMVADKGWRRDRTTDKDYTHRMLIARSRPQYKPHLQLSPVITNLIRYRTQSIVVGIYHDTTSNSLAAQDRPQTYKPEVPYRPFGVWDNIASALVDRPQSQFTVK